MRIGLEEECSCMADVTHREWCRCCESSLGLPCRFDPRYHQFSKKEENPKTWRYGANVDWRWSEDCRCYYEYKGNTIPGSYCLGDRMIHVNYGRDSYGIIWTGSTSHNWHGWGFGYDLGEALRWVRAADYTDRGPALWSGSLP